MWKAKCGCIITKEYKGEEVIKIQDPFKMETIFPIIGENQITRQEYFLKFISDHELQCRKTQKHIVLGLSSEHKQVDMVNHPPHYTQGKYEVIDVIDDWKLDFYLGNAVKYIARAHLKGNQLEDLKKAQWYLNRKIQRLENIIKDIEILELVEERR